MAPLLTATLLEPTQGPYVAIQPKGCGNRLIVVGGGTEFRTFSKKTTAISSDGTVTALADRTATPWPGGGPGGGHPDVLATDGECWEGNNSGGGTPEFGVSVLANGDLFTVGYVEPNFDNGPGAARFVAATETWAALPSLEPRDPGSGYVWNDNAFWHVYTLANGKVLALNEDSQYASDFDSYSTAYCSLWDPATNLWTKIAAPIADFVYTLPGSNTGIIASCQLSDGRVLAVAWRFDGAVDDPDVAFCWAIYDPTTGWTATQTHTIASPVPAYPTAGQRLIRQWGSVVPLDAGRALVSLAILTTGFTGVAGVPCLVFDGSGWTTTGGPAVKRLSWGMAGSCAGEAFMAGGDLHNSGSDYVPTDSIERYDATSGTWSAFDVLPSPRFLVKAIVQCSEDGVSPSRLWCVGGLEHWWDPLGAVAEAVAYRGTLACNCECGGATDTVPPVVSNFTPANGSLRRDDAIGFDVTDDVGLRRVHVVAEFPDGAWELVHDGTRFAPLYEVGGQRTAITGGYHYDCARQGGWRGRSLKIRVYPVDTGGNEA